MSSCQLTSRVVQAYIAVQIFVERCLMNLEPEVVVDLTKDDTWKQWEWMKRYRIWEANREVFLYPENWLIESQRPDRTEIYRKLEQEVHQGQSTTDHLETVVHNYIDRLDGLAHLLVTGTCQDPVSGTIYVVARTSADPPAYYLRSYTDGAWTGWGEIPLGIKALHVIPATYRRRGYLFWLDVEVSNEPQQQMPAKVPEPGKTPPPEPPVDRYVTLGVHFSVFRNGSWAPPQASKGKLFDKPTLNPKSAGDSKTVEGLYTLKVQAQGPHLTKAIAPSVAPAQDSTHEDILVASGAGFPPAPPPFMACIDSELVKVDTISPDGGRWGINRSSGGPAHNIGAPIYVPALTITRLTQPLDSAHKQPHGDLSVASPVGFPRGRLARFKAPYRLRVGGLYGACR
jgi:hypothetical protein